MSNRILSIKYKAKLKIFKWEVEYWNILNKQYNLNEIEPYSEEDHNRAKQELIKAKQKLSKFKKEFAEHLI